MRSTPIYTRLMAGMEMLRNNGAEVAVVYVRSRHARLIEQELGMTPNSLRHLNGARVKES